MVSARCASCWNSRRLRPGLAAVVFVAVVAHARYGHRLRFYIRPHFAKCSPVVSLKLRSIGPRAPVARPPPKGAPSTARLCFWVLLQVW